MRSRNASALLFVLAATGCSLDAAQAPRATPPSLLVHIGDASASSTTWSIRGTLETTETGAPVPGTPIVNRHLEGRGVASHLGRFTVVGDITLNLATASGSGTGVYTAANGDVITVTVVGQAVIGAGTATVTESVTVTGGTGRFEGASGTFTVVRRVIQATGHATGTIDGTISLAK